MSGDRDNMTYSLIDELTGCNEQWTINANDVLSFARQVAVAMVTYQQLNLHRLMMMMMMMID